MKTSKGNTVMKKAKGKRILIDQEDYQKYLAMKEAMKRRELSQESKKKYGLEWPRGAYKGGLLATDKSAQALTGFHFGQADAGRGSKFMHRDFFKWAQGLILHDETAIALFNECMGLLESEKTFEDFVEKQREKEEAEKQILDEFEEVEDESDGPESFNADGPEAFEEIRGPKPNPNRDLTSE